MKEKAIESQERGESAVPSSVLFDIRDDHDDEYVHELIFSRSASAVMPGDNDKLRHGGENL